MILCDYLQYVKIFYVKGTIGCLIKEEPGFSVLGPVFGALTYSSPALCPELGQDKSPFCPNNQFLFKGP